MSCVRVVTTALLLAQLPAEAADFRQLRGPDIKARLAGMELTDGTHWSMTFVRDGTLISYEMGAETKRKWRVQQDELCMTETSAERCYTVWINVDRIQLRRPGTLPEEGMVQKPRRKQ